MYRMEKVKILFILFIHVNESSTGLPPQSGYSPVRHVRVPIQVRPVRGNGWNRSLDLRTPMESLDTCKTA